METDPDARLWAMLAHLSAFAVLTSIPLANVLGPLVVWLVKRDKHPFVDDQGKEALNFQISVTIYAVAIAVVALPFAFVGALLPFAPGVLLLPVVILAVIALLVFALVSVILAAVKSNEGVAFRYPLTLRLVR